MQRARPAKWTDLSLVQLAKAEGKIIIPTRWEEARRGRGRERERRSREYGESSREESEARRSFPLSILFAQTNYLRAN
jgi:hypothetical protein